MIVETYVSILVPDHEEEKIYAFLPEYETGIYSNNFSETELAVELAEHLNTLTMCVKTNLPIVSIINKTRNIVRTAKFRKYTFSEYKPITLTLK